MRKAPGEAGFSLVEVLVGLGVLGVCAMLYFQARTAAMMTSKSIEGSKVITDVNDALIAELGAIVRAIDPAVPGCLNLGAVLNGRALAKANGTARLNYTLNVLAQQWLPEGISAAERRKIASSIEKSPVLHTPSNRCRRSHLPTSPTLASDNTFYFCMNISKDSSALAQSFLSSPLSFAEVGWQLINLHTGAPLSCSDFNSVGKAAGAQVFYNVYWATSLGGEYTFKNYVNTFTVGK